MSGYSDLNEKHFDSIASSYNEKPGFKELNERLSEEIRSRLDWLGVDWLDPDSEDEHQSKTVKAFDYACGTGNLSKTFAPFCSSIIGADVSSGMVQTYNSIANAQGLEPSEMKAVHGDLLSTPPSKTLDASEFYDFDLAMCGLAFHHFEDINLAAARMVERVKKGSGKVMIVDFLPHAPFNSGSSGHGHSHEHGHGHSDDSPDVQFRVHSGEDEQNRSHAHGPVDVDMPPDELDSALKTVKHMGISEETITSAFEKAGCNSIKMEVLGTGLTMISGGKKLHRTIYMLVATRNA